MHFHLQTGGGYTAQWESLIVLGGHRIVSHILVAKDQKSFQKSSVITFLSFQESQNLTSTPIKEVLESVGTKCLAYN